MKSEESYLLKGIKAGEELAFKYAFDTYYLSLCLYAKKLLGDLDKARELSQDVFVRLYENREQLIITSSLRAYLFKAVHNKCLNYLKQAQLHHLHHTQLQSYTPEWEETDTLLEQELEERLLLAVSKLPGQCGRIFRMNRLEGKRNKEIALELGISIRTVETQISKALVILRTELAGLLPLILLLSLLAI